MNKLVVKKRKVRLLIAAHVGYPEGGISVNYCTLLSSSLQNELNLFFVETSGNNLAFTQRGEWKPKNFINSVKNIISFISAVKQTKPDIVHIGTAYGASFAKHSVMVLIAHCWGLRTVIQLHCNVDKLLTEPSFLWKSYTKWILGLCCGILVLSSEWQSISKLFPHALVSYIPNAIDPKIYQYIPRPKIGSKHDNPVHILFLGHLGTEKGVLDLLEAVSIMMKNEHRPFDVNLVGGPLQGGDLYQIDQLIMKIGVGNIVHILPPVYGQEKIAQFANADIFVLPSFHEGMPISIIEAMVSGLPVIATKVGGIADEVVPDETGLLIPIQNPSKLAEALLKLVNDESLRLQLGLAGRRRACELFNIDNKVAAHLKFYNNVLNKKL